MQEFWASALTWASPCDAKFGAGGFVEGGTVSPCSKTPSKLPPPPLFCYISLLQLR